MIVLAVSRLAQRGTSGMIEGLAACFTGLEDPRETRRCDHQLVDILVIAVCAVIACAESWEDCPGRDAGERRVEDGYHPSDAIH
jgi:hypothetical protein